MHAALVIDELGIDANAIGGAKHAALDPWFRVVERVAVCVAVQTGFFKSGSFKHALERDCDPSRLARK